eukprot:15358362-Ditylum_brightwellii.AAC.1
MKEVAEHVPFQLPNDFARVEFLLAAIKCSDVGLQAAMANIKSDADETSAMGNRHHFELAATYLLPFCLVLKMFLSSTKHDDIKISDTTSFGFETKESTGTSGVSWCNKSKWGQQRKAQGQGKGQGDSGMTSSKHDNYKQGRAMTNTVHTSTKAISKKK